MVHHLRPIRRAAMRTLAVIAVAVAAGCTAAPPAPSPTDAAAAADAPAEPSAAPDPAADPEAESAARTPSGAPDLVVYSGRSESLVGPLIETFEATSGLDVDVRFGDTGELALTLLEEGARSPADVFFGQEPGGLGKVSALLAPLPEDVLAAVDTAHRSDDGRWVGVSGRQRVVVFNTSKLAEADLPQDVRAFTDEAWRGRVGWAPGNASFLSMLTAMRLAWGEDAARDWVEAMVANGAVPFAKNGEIVAAVADGQVDVGFVNHYYLFGFLAEEGDDFPARNHVLADGGPASILLVAGAAILETAPHRAAAEQFVRFLLSAEAQRYFAEKTFEYPLAAGVAPDPRLPALDALPQPEVDLGALSDIDGSLAIVRDAGALP